MNGHVVTVKRVIKKKPTAPRLEELNLIERIGIAGPRLKIPRALKSLLRKGGKR